MSNKKTKIILGVILALLVVAFAAAYFVFTPQGSDFDKTIVFEVTHSDGAVREFTIGTDLENLRGALEQENLIEGNESAYGLYVTVIDGEQADDSKREWWCFTQDGEMLNTGVDDTVISDGDHYEASISVY